MRLDPVRAVQAVVVVFIAALLISEALLYVPGARPHLGVDQQFVPLGRGQLELYTNASGTFDANLEQALLSVVELGTPRTIDYYFDANYPPASNTVADWFGLTQHLQAVASARELPLNLTLLNAVQLGGLLSRPPPPSTLLVLASGVLPDTVYAPPKNLLLPWIRQGGSAVWVGPAIGAYEGLPIAPGAQFGQLQYFPNGTRAFLPGLAMGGNALVLPTASAWATALYLDYPYAIVNESMSSSSVASLGGRVLGFGDGTWSNAAAFPLGNGSLIDIAAPGFDVVRLSFALVNLVQSGGWSPSSLLVGASSFSVSPGSPYSSHSVWPAPGAGTHLCAFSVESDYLAPFATDSCS